MLTRGHSLYIVCTSVSPLCLTCVISITVKCMFALFQKRFETWFVVKEALLTFRLSNCLIY